MHLGTSSRTKLRLRQGPATAWCMGVTFKGLPRERGVPACGEAPATSELRKFSLTTTKNFVILPPIAMKKPRPMKPTDAELSILKALWAQGPSTVREVWEHLSPDQETGYTTILKLLQIMLEKGLVTRDDAARSHVYRAALSEDQTQRQVVRQVMDRLFSGSARKLVLQALAVKKASPAELEEIRQLLDQIEREHQ